MSGYLVLNQSYKPMEIGRYREDEPFILWNGKEGTVFKTYDHARCAIRRTIRYARRQGVEWGDLSGLQIMRVIWRA